MLIISEHVFPRMRFRTFVSEHVNYYRTCVSAHVEHVLPNMCFRTCVSEHVLRSVDYFRTYVSEHVLMRMRFLF